MKVTFKEDFDWDVPEHKGLATVAFKAGVTETVTRACGEAAVAAGKAVEVTGAAETPKAQPAK